MRSYLRSYVRSVWSVSIFAAVTFLASACGSQPATTASATRPGGAVCAPHVSSQRRGATVSVDNADNRKVACIRVGVHVLVLLSGSPTRKWTVIRSDSGALAPRASGRLALRVGETGAFFAAVHRGVVHITSTRPACRPGSSARCLALSEFRLTVRVSG